MWEWQPDRADLLVSGRAGVKDTPRNVQVSFRVPILKNDAGPMKTPSRYQTGESKQES
jgi:hypothetical protein